VLLLLLGRRAGDRRTRQGGRAAPERPRARTCTLAAIFPASTPPCLHVVRETQWCAQLPLLRSPTRRSFRAAELSRQARSLCTKLAAALDLWRDPPCAPCHTTGYLHWASYWEGSPYALTRVLWASIAALAPGAHWPPRLSPVPSQSRAMLDRTADQNPPRLRGGANHHPLVRSVDFLRGGCRGAQSPARAELAGTGTTMEQRQQCLVVYSQC
jgi:hypothetical protein